MQVPTKNRVTQGRHGQYNAVDYSARDRLWRWRKTFYAPEAGKITAYGKSGQCGNRLELTAGSNRHGFCHLEKSLVRVGQSVKRGQAIGVMGYTGYTIPSGVNGTHLHWVINRGGKYVYPPTLVNQSFVIYKPVVKQYTKVRAGEGLSHIAKRVGYKLWWSPTTFAKIAKLNGSSNWVVYNRNLKPGQRIRVR